jgi:hypothetical protein
MLLLLLARWAGPTATLYCWSVLQHMGTHLLLLLLLLLLGLRPGLPQPAAARHLDTGCAAAAAASPRPARLSSLGPCLSLD